MRIKSWQKFNESNEYRGPKFIHDLLLDPFIDDHLCDVSGNNSFMRFEFHNTLDFNEAKETIEEWNIGGWTTYDDNFILAWDKELEDFFIEKIRSCKVINDGNNWQWIDGDIVMAKLNGTSLEFLLNYEEIWVVFWKRWIQDSILILELDKFIKYMFSTYLPSEDYTDLIIKSEIIWFSLTKLKR